MILRDRLYLTILENIAKIRKTPDAYFKYAFEMYTVFKYSRNDISADEVLDAFTTASKAGSADAAWQLYRIFSGEDVIITNKKDDTEARSYLKLAAERGIPDAQNLYGSILLKRNKISEAEQLLKNALDAGCEDARKTLEELEACEKVKIDTAQSWYLSGLVCLGKEDEESIQNAEKYFGEAAELGMEDAKYELALLLLNGEEDGEKKKEALELLEYARRCGNGDAAFKLYEMGNYKDNQLLEWAVRQGSIAASIYQTKSKLEENKYTNRGDVTYSFFEIRDRIAQKISDPHFMWHKVNRERIATDIGDFWKLGNCNGDNNILNELVNERLYSIDPSVIKYIEESMNNDHVQTGSDKAWEEMSSE